MPPKKAAAPPPPPGPPIPPPPIAPPVYNPTFPLSVLFKYNPYSNDAGLNDLPVDPTDANQQQARQLEIFKRSIREKGNTLKYDENLAEKKKYALEYPDNYLTQREAYHNNTYEEIERIYYDFVLIHLASGDTEKEAFRKTTASFYNIRRYCAILMENQYPDEATRIALRIKELKQVRAKLGRITAADNLAIGAPIPIVRTELSDAIDAAARPTINFQNLIGHP